MKQAKILVSEDQELWREEILGVLLRKEGYHVATEKTIEGTLSRLNREFFHVVIADICFSLADHDNTDGVQTVAKISNLEEGTCVIVVTGFGTVELAVKALREYKVFHFLEKGDSFDQGRFLQVVADAARAAEVGHIHRYGLVAFESVVEGQDIQVATSRLQVKKDSLRWCAMNLVNQAAPVTLGSVMAELVSLGSGSVLQRPLWSRMMARPLLLRVGKREIIQELLGDEAKPVAEAEMRGAMGVLLAHDELDHADF